MYFVGIIISKNPSKNQSGMMNISIWMLNNYGRSGNKKTDISKLQIQQHVNNLIY